MFGIFFILLINVKRFPIKHLVFPSSFAVFQLAKFLTTWSGKNLPYSLNIEPLLVCIVGGFLCVNVTVHHQRFVHLLHSAVKKTRAAAQSHAPPHRMSAVDEREQPENRSATRTQGCTAAVSWRGLRAPACQEACGHLLRSESASRAKRPGPARLHPRNEKHTCFTCTATCKIKTTRSYGACPPIN